MTTTTAIPSTNPSTKQDRIKLSGSLRWVSITQMKVSPVAQRDLNQSRVNKIAAEFDLDRIGIPTVSARDGWFWLIDGQHRVEALKAIGYGDQKVECIVYEGLTEAQEAEAFLLENDRLAVSAYDKYTKAVAAGRPTESAIDRVIHAHNCMVSRNQIPGAIAAPGTLVRIYNRSGEDVLSSALHIAIASYGDAGLDGPVLDGLGYLCARYDGTLDPEKAVAALSSAMGGMKGLMNKAEVIRRQTGKPRGQCIAAAAVEIHNSRRGAKLPSWWKE